MPHPLDDVARAMSWGCASCALASLLSLFGLANFWMAFWGSWLLSSGSSFLLFSLAVPASGRAVLVTSCDSGIGQDLALHLDNLGFRVFAGCRLAEAHGKGAERLRRVRSSRLHVLQLDVSKQEQLDLALRTVRNTLTDGEILWGLVNNSELSTYGAVEWVPMSTYRKLMDVNLFGTIATTKTFLPLLRKARGRVVNVSSIEGRFSSPLSSTYQLTKHAVECFSDCLRNEMRRFGVDVSIVEPGNCVTGSNYVHMEEEEEEEEAIKREVQQMWTTMEEEVKRAYGSIYFDHVVSTRLAIGRSQLTDQSSVVEILTEALTQKFPRSRYVCTSLSLIFMTFVAEHFPEWVFDWLYV